MRVIKRSGETEDVSFDKVLKRIKNLSSGLTIDPYDIAQKVCTRIYNHVSTAELDELAAHICSSLIIEHPDYGELASRIIISNHHKNTSPSFSETINALFHEGLVSRELYETVFKYKEKLNSYLDYARDYSFDYFGFKTLERAYLMRVNGVVMERPQHMFMRVSLGIHAADIKDALQTYDYMSQKYFIHATPTLFNSGTPRPQLSSCFLLASEDSIDGIYDTLKECAKISKYAGGIGMHIHDIRARGSKIRGTNGQSTGIVPMLRVYNNTARYVNQCFTPDTLVWGEMGLVCMSAVKVGDKLVTIDGSFKPVLEVCRRTADEELLAIYIKGVGVPLKCTQVHEIGVFVDGAVTFKPASELQIDDLMYFPSNFGSCVPVVAIDRFNYVGDVYDFNMEDNHNYLTSHGLVHNSGKRNGSIAVYLEPWHADVEGFLELRKPHGNEEERARDLFLALWVPDLFMERVRVDGVWSLMCPDVCQGLSDVYGSEFEKLYTQYEREGKFVKQVSAQKLWFKILESQIESGQPYICYKDASNAKSNQKNLGTIKSSNLCVSGDTWLTCEHGHHRIASLEGQLVRVWNGHEYSNVQIVKTGEDIPLVRVNFNNGMWVKCTLYHKFYIWEDGREIVVSAEDLVPGMQVSPYHVPISVSQDALAYLATASSEEGETRVFKGEDLRYVYLLLQQLGIAKYASMLDGRIVISKSAYAGVGRLGETEIVYIDSIEDAEEGDTYCFKEPLRARGMFNGVVLGNCTEIIEYSGPEEHGVCNLGSIALPSYFEDGVFDFERLHEMSKVLTKNLNKVIDVNFYPVENARRSNLRHRPIGIGVQGLADLFAMFKMPFESADAAALNRDIFETIYHGALEASMEIAKKRHEYAMELRGDTERVGELYKYLKYNEFDPDVTSAYPGAYASFAGSPASQGLLQFDLWGVVPSRYDWDALKRDIKQYGLRNSLLLAPMPTASTSQILGFNECFEAFTSNIYKRKTMAGEFILVNKYLVRDLMAQNLWTKEIKDQIILYDGSVQDIPEIPSDVKDIYKTVWEIKQKAVIDMAADRGAFICQSQSLNLFMEDPDFKKLSSMHFYAWSKGLKTGMYYLRSKPKAAAQKFTLDPKLVKRECVPDPETGACLLCSA